MGNFMGVVKFPSAPSKLRAYQLVGFFYIYFCGCFKQYISQCILPEYIPTEFLVSVNSFDTYSN